jgi:hypothetical protein
MNFREDEPDGGLPPKKRRFGKRRVDDARVEDKAEAENIQGDYRDQDPAYDPDEMHGPLGTVRPDGEKNYFSEERLQEFYIKDLIEAKHHEVLFFYRELLAITLTLLFVLILALANGAKIL